MVKKKFTRIGSLFMTAVFAVTGTVCMGTVAASAATSDTEPSGSGGATAVLNNEAGWSTCNVYYWGNDGGVKNASWPGKALSASDKNAEGFYEVHIDSQYLSGKNGVIFNNGSDQSADLSIAEGDCKVYNNKTKSWTDYDTNQLKLSFTTDIASPQYKGTAITLNASASGGSGTLTYTFKANSTTLYTGSNATTTWTPTAAGSYTLSVSVKDTAGNTNSKSVTYEIKDDANATDPILKGISTGSDDNTGVVNTNVPITVNAAGGKIGTNLLFYKVAVTDPSGNAVNTVYYKQSNVLNFTPSKTGNYTVDVTVQNSYNTTVNNKYTVNVLASGSTYTKPTVSAFTTNPTTVEKGNAVKLSVTVANGQADYTYTYKVNDSTVKTNTSSSKTNTYSWTPTTAGTYKLSVTVKDAKGNSASKTISSYTVTEPVEENPPVISSATLSPSTAQTGDTVAVKAVIKSGTGTPNFKYTFKINDTTVKTASNVTSRSYTYNWTPTEAGTYKIEVVITDAESKRASKVISSTYKVTKPVSNDVTIESFTAEKTRVGVNDTVAITTKIKDGTGTPGFKYVIKANDERITSHSGNERSFTYTWKPTIKGDYKFVVVVTDATGKVVKAVINNIKVVNNPNPTLESVTLDKPNGIELGDSVNITAKIMTGTGTPKFKYRFRINGTFLKTTTTTSKTVTYNWKPEEAGNYKIEVYVYDANNTIVRKTVSTSYPVISNYTAPVISSATMSKSTATTGEQVAVKTVVKSGTGLPNFKYTVKINGETVCTAKDISARNYTYNWTPTAAGTYKIEVVVTDAKSGRASKVISSTYKVTKGSFLKGDVTGDGKVDSSDTAYVMGYVGGDTTNYPIPKDSDKFKAADVNGDGQITIDDAIAISAMY